MHGRGTFTNNASVSDLPRRPRGTFHCLRMSSCRHRTKPSPVPAPGCAPPTNAHRSHNSWYGVNLRHPFSPGSWSKDVESRAVSVERSARRTEYSTAHVELRRRNGVKILSRALTVFYVFLFVVAEARKCCQFVGTNPVVTRKLYRVWKSPWRLLFAS